MELYEIVAENHSWQFKVRHGTGEASIVREVLHDEYYQQALSLLGEGSAVIDVGAHIGSFSIFAAARGARVLALEPIPANYDLLSENIRLNHLQAQVKALNLAAWSCEGERMLSVADDSTGGSSFYYWNKSAPQIPVHCVRLTKLMDDEGIAVCDVLKLDCEGSELEVLQGLSEEAWERVRVVVGEYHLFADYSLEQLENLLVQQGFLVLTKPAGVIGYLLAIRPLTDLPLPLPIPPMSISLSDSPFTRLPIIGPLWRMVRRPLHSLVVFYMNQLIATYNQRQRQTFVYLRWLAQQEKWRDTRSTDK